MDPINPWLDADELRRLAESLMQNGHKKTVTPDVDAGFSDAFVGFAGSVETHPVSVAPASTATLPIAIPAEPTSPPPAQPTLPPPAATPPTTTQAPLPTVPNLIPVASPAAQPTSAIEAQCLLFQSNMQQSFGADGLFILNRDGHTVFGKDQYPKLQFIARSLTQHGGRRGLPKGHIHIKIGPGQTLEIIPVDLPNGGWIVGAVVPTPLQPNDIKVWVQEISKLSSLLNQL